MDKKQRLMFVAEQIMPQVGNYALDPMTFSVREVEKLVARWRIGKPVDVVMVPRVENGFLFINGEPVGRIAPKWTHYTERAAERADFWEGRILARQGT